MSGTYYKKYDTRIGIVCDAILFDSLKSAATFVPIPPSDDWKEKIRGCDLLLVVSTWKGLKDEEWRGLGITGNDKRRVLLDIIEACRSAGRPTVFYSKEDPPNYKVFLDFAKRCDYVFTSAEEVVDDYRRDCGHDRVGVLPFGIDPALQNPVGCRPFHSSDGVVFSGSWMIKYPFRCRDLGALLDGAVKSGRSLTIIDRNSYRAANPGYRFPRRFGKFLRSALPHDELQELHRQYAWSINVNSVTSSESMFAGRCYELLACGCPVISNASVGMLKRLPEIAIADSVGYAAWVMKETAPRQLEVRRAAGIRRVMTGETCYDRIGAILKAIGLEAEQPRRSVLVIVPERTPDLLSAFASQTYADRELCLASEYSEDLRRRHAYVTEWLPGETYGPFWLQDLIDAFKYTDADFVTAGGGYYETIFETSAGHTVSRTAVQHLIHGFAVPLLNETPSEVSDEIMRTHEIVCPVVRSLASVRPSLWARALACYMDNGLVYTIRRILLGKQY